MKLTPAKLAQEFKLMFGFLFSLKDPDISIRRRALDLVYSMCDTSSATRRIPFQIERSIRPNLDAAWMRGHGNYIFVLLHPRSIQRLGKSMDGGAETWMCIQASALHFRPKVKVRIKAPLNTSTGTPEAWYAPGGAGAGAGAPPPPRRPAAAGAGRATGRARAGEG